MFEIFSIGALFLGAIIGSFLNALSFRYNTGRSVAHGRSRCMHCGHTLTALDLVPIFSFLFLRGKCRYCRTRLSLQYPLVEAAGALLSLMVFTAHPMPLAYVFWISVWMTLLFVVVYDMRHTIIPWSASGLLAILALLSLFVSFDMGGVIFYAPSIYALLAGPLLALPLALLSLVSGGRWMGWGDSPLQLSLGWLLGLSSGATALLLAFWIGAAVGVALLLLTSLWRWGKKRFTMGSELPFAPFLVLGALIAHFWYVDFFQNFALLFAY